MTLCRSESLRALFAVAASAEVLHCCTLIKILYGFDASAEADACRHSYKNLILS
jgi:hypothetical protein